MAGQNTGQLVLAPHVPNEDGLADAATGQQFAVGAPAAPKHFLRVSFQRLEHVAVIAQIPYCDTTQYR